MKILFVISTLGEGRGGHYHSLNHISRSLSEKLETKIISVGPGRSDILNGNLSYHKNIAFNGMNLFAARKEVKAIINEHRPDIIHCFDVSCYNFLRLIDVRNSYRYVLNKCGGANPVTFPRVENLVLFSKENLNWFSSRPWTHKNLYLIPNRSRRLQLHEMVGIEKDPKCFTFVRICRIGKVYKKSINDTINLFQELSKTLQGIKLIVIGIVQDEEVYLDLVSLSHGSNIQFITDEKYTVEASRLLYLADAVIATGRGVMEASSIGLPVLVPAKNSRFPILINEKNFENFFSTNFSERSIASATDLSDNVSNVLGILSNSTLREKYGKMSFSFFDEYFNVQKSIEKYLKVYKNALEDKYSISCFHNKFSQLRTIKDFYINSRKMRKRGSK